MKLNLLWLLSIGLIIACWMYNIVNAQGEKKECQESMDKLANTQLKLMARCEKLVKFKTVKEKKRRAKCLVVCILKQVKFINEAGYYDVPGGAAFMRENFPPIAAERGVKGFEGCMQYAEQIDPKEDTCSTYDPMLKCGMQILNKMCD